MTCKAYILIALLIHSCTYASAQVGNRHKAMILLLSQSHHRVYGVSKYIIYMGTPWSPTGKKPFFKSLDPIPKYTLPKGNVICRFEDYVQMHTPMKLNIGVGGQ